MILRRRWRGGFPARSRSVIKCYCLWPGRREEGSLFTSRTWTSSQRWGSVPDTASLGQDLSTDISISASSEYFNWEKIFSSQFWGKVDADRADLRNVSSFDKDHCWHWGLGANCWVEGRIVWWSQQQQHDIFPAVQNLEISWGLYRDRVSRYSSILLPQHIRLWDLLPSYKPKLHTVLPLSQVFVLG